MYHPETMYQLAKLKMAEDQRYADHERMVRLAGLPGRRARSMRSASRERLTRLLGAVWPSTPNGAKPTVA